jgi:hypothetical protein
MPTFQWVVADKTVSSTPSHFASRQEAHWSIALEAFSNALVSACVIGWYKPLLRPLILRSMRPRGLILIP